MRRFFFLDTISDMTVRVAIAVLFLASTLCAQQPKRIDPKQSKITVHAYRAGLLSFAGHDHVIDAPTSEGWIDEQKRTVELTIKAATLEVLDPEESEKNRIQIRKDMLGPKLLDAERFPTISFRSTSLTQIDRDTASVIGILTLHGVNKEVKATVKNAVDRFVGTAKLKQSDYGMTPVSVAGGTIKVKDEVKIEFNIATVP
jgi:polyisoprenoid-binding protein YceI